MPDQFGAVHAGHDHVGDQQIDPLAGGAGDAQGVLGRMGGEHVVAQRFEDALGRAQDDFLVFDQQDGFVRARRRIGRRRDGGGRCVFRQILPGQEDLERAALARLAFHADVAAVLLGGAVDGGQAEAGALADGLGGEEGLENVRDDFRLHAAAVVAHGQHGVAAGRQFAGGRAGGDAFRAGFQGDAPGRADGVARIDAEVGHGLVELAGIDLHVADVPAGFPDQLDVLADQAAQHAEHAGDGFVEVEHLRRGRLLAREGLQLARERGRAGGGFLDFLEVRVQRLVGGHLLDGDFDVAENGLEHVVEIVRDAAGEAAEGFQFLGVRQLRLQRGLFLFVAKLAGDVALDGHEIDDAAGGVAHRRDGGLLGIQRAVLALVDELALPGLAGFQDLPHRAVEFPVVLAALEDARGPAEDFLAGVAGDPREGGIHVENLAVGVGDEDRLAGLFDGAGQPFALAFGAFARGDVGDEAFKGDDLALRVVDAFALFPDPAGFAGARRDLVFHLEPAVRAQDALPGGPDQFAVGGQDEVVVGNLAVADQVFRRVAGEVLAPLADELHGPVAVVPAAVGHAGQVGQQRDVAPPALPQFVEGELALGDVAEDAGELARRRAERRYFEIPAQRRGIVLEKGGQARADDVAVDFEPLGFEVGQRFAGGLAEEVRGFQAGHALEGGIDGEEAVVAGFAALVGDDFVQSETFEHVLEERAVVFLGALALGDVAGDAVQFEAVRGFVAPEAGDGFGDEWFALPAELLHFERKERPVVDLAAPELFGALAEQVPQGDGLVGPDAIREGAGQDFIDAVAAQRFGGRTDVEEPERIRVHDPDDVLHVFRQHAVLAFAVAQGVLDALAFGDVLVDPDVADRPVVGVPDEGNEGGGPEGFAVFPPLEMLALPEPLGEKVLAEAGFVGRVHRARDAAVRFAQDFGRRVAVERFRLAVPVLDVAVQIRGDHGFVHAVQQLGLQPQMRLGALAFGDVARGTVQFEPAGPLVGPEAADGFGLDDGSVRARERDFQGEERFRPAPAGAAIGRRGAQAFHDRRAPVRGEGGVQRLGQDVRGGAAAQRFDGRADVEEAARFDVGDPDDVLHVFRQHAVLAFAFAEGFFRAHALGHVDVGAHEQARRPALGVGEHLAAGPDPGPGAVAPPHAETQVERPVRLPQIAGQIAVRGVPVAGVDQIQPAGGEGPPLRREGERGRIMAQHGEVLRTAPDPLRGDVVFPRAGVRGLDQRGVATGRRLVFLEQPGQAFFVAPAVGDVGFGAPIPPRPALLVPQRNAGGGDPDGFARLRHQRTGRSLDGLAPRGQREPRRLVGRPAFRRIQIVEVFLADQFFRAVAQNRFGRVAHVDVEAVDVGFPRDDAVLLRQQVEVVRAFGQFPGLLLGQMRQIFAAVDGEAEDERRGAGDGQPGQQHQPAEMEGVVGEEMGRRPHGDGIGPAEREDGPGNRPVVRQPRRRRAREIRRGDRGEPARRFTGPQAQQIQRDLHVFRRIFPEETAQERLGVHGGHGEPQGGAVSLDFAHRPEHEDQVALAGGARQRREHGRGRDQAGCRCDSDRVADGGDGRQVAAGRDAVFREGLRRFDVVDGIMARKFGGRHGLAGGIRVPDAVFRRLPAGVADGLLEFRSSFRFHGRDPGPSHHFGHADEVARVALEFFRRHDFAAFDEPGQAFELGTPQAEESVQNALAPDLGHRAEGFSGVGGLDEPRQPRRGQGQDQADGRGQERFEMAPAAPPETVGVPVAPADQRQSRCQQQQQRSRCRQRHARRPEGLGVPGGGVDVDAHHGDQPVGFGIGQRHERADPRAPAIGDRSFGGRDALVEHFVEQGGRFGIELAGRGGIGRVEGLGIHLEIDDAVFPPAHQVDPFPVGIDLLRRHELFLQAAIFGFLLVGAVALQNPQPIDRHGLGHAAGLLEQVVAQAAVFAAVGPVGQRRAQRGHRQ